MRKSIVLPLVITALTLNVGCASKKRVTIDAAPTAHQESAFMRGGVKLSSDNHKSELTVVDYSHDEMVVAISIANNKTESFLFSDKNIKAQHLHSNKGFNAKIYSYEELLAEYGNSDYATVMQVGSTAASIGTAFIPFGGIAMSLGRLLFSLADQGVSHKDRVNSLVASQLNQLYLRQHTVEVDKEYGGIVKIGFAEELKRGDKVLFNISIGNTIESFTFVCK
ncbi:MAG: hypothetical protein GQ569_15130 [Methylococcaceae bacterium]|nr:hypothetical protein [Methylococcaceae bacterium]